MAVGEYISVSSQRDAEKAHAAKAKHQPGELTSPLQAAVASFLAFSVGGLIPFLAIVVAPPRTKLWATIIAVFIALLLTGYFSARASGAAKPRVMLRVVIGGLLAMAITYYIGMAFGAVIA